MSASSSVKTGVAGAVESANGGVAGSFTSISSIAGGDGDRGEGDRVLAESRGASLCVITKSLVISSIVSHTLSISIINESSSAR